MKKTELIPSEVLNWVAGEEKPARTGRRFEKIEPVYGRTLCRAARSSASDVSAAVTAARKAFPAWAATPAVERGMMLHRLVVKLQENRKELARIVALETGKSMKDASGEISGAAALGLFYAGEGQRLYGRTTTSAIKNRLAMTLRQPLGVAGLIVAANTPAANVAWKAFPALICGNAVVLKAAEDAPATAWYFGKMARAAGLPAGVLNIIQGFGKEAGAPLVSNPEVDVVSFTGSAGVGRQIAEAAGRRLVKISLELGGKNPLVVCDDADLEAAVKWVLLSAFSNAGQRCAAASRVIVFKSVYTEFSRCLTEEALKLKIGPGDGDDLGPVINEKQMNNILGAVEKARRNGARILCGGYRLSDKDHRGGFFIVPTVIDRISPRADISRVELFGPVTCLYPARDFDEAIVLANDSDYGLTASIHTRNLHRAVQFIEKTVAGVVSVNGGTYGSEPHMPFGGRKMSGNGWREPGTEALDIYSELKDVYLNVDPGLV